jgi:hypothetical protein
MMSFVVGCGSREVDNELTPLDCGRALDSVYSVPLPPYPKLSYSTLFLLFTLTYLRHYVSFTQLGVFHRPLLYVAGNDDD